MVCNVIKTGSTGNSVIYHDSIMVDCGVPLSLIKPFVYEIHIVLLSHEHTDHININTLKSLQFERPTLRIGCGSHMLPHLERFKNIDVYEAGETYDYGSFKISPIALYHDVKNFGYRIFKGDHKIFHATDTSTLEGIEAKGYDLYAIEHNYDDEYQNYIINKKHDNNEYAYELRAMNSHLSEQQAKDFIGANKKESSGVIKLHESDKYKLK